MKIVFILTREPDSTIETIIRTNRERRQVEVIRLGEVDDFGQLVDTIEKCDRVITW
ncbi:MAG: hypothetical protein Kow0089_02530 [Desulfobulbaceae bacterium]